MAVTAQSGEESFLSLLISDTNALDIYFLSQCQEETLHRRYLQGWYWVSFLRDLKGQNWKNFLLVFRKGAQEFSAVMKQLEKGVNVIQSSSTGRVLDAAAAMLGICEIRTYEGEPAMKLESAAKKSTHIVDLPLVFRKAGKSGLPVLDTTELLLGVYELLGKYSSADLAFAVEESLAKGISELAVSLAAKRGLEKIGLSGGVAYNDHITSCIAGTVREAGFEFLAHRQVPCGDGCISFGQALAAGLRDKS